MAYTRRFVYENAAQYGFVGVETREYVHSRVLDAEGCAAYLGTHCDHITLEEPDRTAFFEGIRRAVREAGDRIEYRDRVRLTLARRPR